jgi:microcystin-dependent protein
MQPYVGEIRMFAGSFAPRDWMLCQGQRLPVSEYETLFAVIGTTYGGDGQSTFNLPDLQGRAPMQMGTGGGGTYIIGENGGVENVNLTISQIPAHNHLVQVATKAGDLRKPASAVLSTEDETVPNRAPVYAPYAGNNLIQLNKQTVSMAGASQPHSNMQASLAINFIISLWGIFPSQN